MAPRPPAPLPRIVGIVVALTVLAAGAGAFGGAAGPGAPSRHLAVPAASAASAAAARTAARRHSLILITLDTTRADHLGAWGWPHAHTPNLDALAARGTRFVRCDTAAPITRPSHPTPPPP